MGKETPWAARAFLLMILRKYIYLEQPCDELCISEYLSNTSEILIKYRAFHEQAIHSQWKENQDAYIQ